MGRSGHQAGVDCRNDETSTKVTVAVHGKKLAKTRERIYRVAIKIRQMKFTNSHQNDTQYICSILGSSVA